MTDLKRYHDALKRRDDALRDIAVIREERWALYHKPKPEGEPHEEGCQKHKSRYGDLKGAACTCESNAVRRREAVFDAGIADDRVILDSLGCMEQVTWWDGRRSVDNGVTNPYRTERPVRMYTCDSGLPEGTCSCYACHGG